MRHEAIYVLYPNVTKIGDIAGAFDADGNKVEVDENLVQAKLTKLQSEYDAQAYSRNRQKNFPNEHDLLIALWEKVMEGRSESADALEVKRQEVKTANPKPE